MFGVVWHFWIGVVLTAVTVLAVGAIAAGYLRKVESSRYPKGR